MISNRTMIWKFAAVSSMSWNLPMDEAALANKLKSLDLLWSSLDWWLNFSTLTVVIGVVMELVVIAIEHRHDKHDFERGIIHSPDKPSSVLLAFSLLGAGLVALGVAGEFRIHVKAGRVETDIRDTTRQLVSLVDDKAQSANERASVNEIEARRLERENLGLQADLLRLRIEAGARRLSGKQKTALRKALEAHPTPIFVGWNPSDNEAGDLAADFISALTEAHWPMPPTHALWGSVQKYGVFLGFTDPEMESVPEFNLLKDALKEIGMPATSLKLSEGDRTLMPPAQSHVLYLLIGAHSPVKSGK